MLYEEESGDIRFALVGDALISRRLQPYREPRFLALRDILRAADVSVANSETLFHAYESSPISDSGPYGTYAACDPEVIDDLKWMGIKMVSTANNHVVDFGEEGILINMRNLRAHGMPFAGTGRTLSEAAAPTYMDTPRGSVALIGVTLTMPPADHRAGDPRGPIKGRPGANVLRHTVVHTVPEAHFNVLREVGRGLGLGPRFRETEGGGISLFGQAFVPGAAYAKASYPNDFDMQLNLRWIADARRMADWVVVSMHNHERGATLDEPAEFALTFARACIDAGADVVFGHGPHQERGIEIYHGKPILYALGNFVLHNDLIKWEPWDLYNRYGLGPEATTADVYDFRSGNGTRGMAVEPIRWQTVIAEVIFSAHALHEIVLHPVDLGYSTGKRSQRGRPMLAEGPVAKEILGRVQRLSSAFGTPVEIENRRGVIRVG
jgi:poly-gamma-glutamate capsule biosynthesis protein CapA/YwtB (metallophosphatase superfamily)